jgi:two-component system OmpR family response regulator
MSDLTRSAAEDAPNRRPQPVSGRILLVEDDESLASEVALFLRESGHCVTCLSNGAEVLASPAIENFNLFVVDRMLPGLDGLTLIERLRGRGMNTPVLVVSALGAVDERVRGLKAGGDDYLTKPFALVELAARVEALLRRPLDTRQTVLSAGPLVMDLVTHKVTRDGKAVELQPREFKLLEYFMRREGQLITRAMLLEEVWNYRFVLQTNLVDVHIGKLRRKIDGGEHTLIESVRGSGFIFAST